MVQEIFNSKIFSAATGSGLGENVFSLSRRCIVAALALCFVFTASSSFAQEHESITPAAKSFKLGAFDISVLRDGALEIPNNGTIFGLNATPAEVADVLHKAGADTIHLDIDALLVHIPNHIVLIDTGYGPAGHGLLPESLAKADVAPNEVTDILITHSHPDHIGGLVDAQGQLAFPKAAIRMSATEWAFMQGNQKLAKEVAVIKGQVQTFEPGQPVLPGITPVALPGHTPGQTGYEIDSQGQKLLDICDIAHSSIVSLARPDWTIAWDADKQEGVQTRQHELQLLATNHELMFAPHFPFPGVGHIEQAGKGYIFKPGLP